MSFWVKFHNFVSAIAQKRIKNEYMNHKWLIFGFSCMLLMNCGHRKSTNSPENLSIDTTKIVVFQYDSTYNWIFEHCSQAELTNHDFRLSDSILSTCINNYNIDQEKFYAEICNKYPDSKHTKDQFTIDLPQYKRQYVCVTNKQGEKEVWINFFRESSLPIPFEGEIPNRWKTEIIRVHDGGNDYFNVKINLTTKQY